MTLIILTISLLPQVYMTLHLRYFIYIENQSRENTNQVSRKRIKWIPQLKGGRTKGNEILYAVVAKMAADMHLIVPYTRRIELLEGIRVSVS